MKEMRETQVRFLGREDPLRKEMATHSTILGWRIPWTRGALSGYSPWGRKESDTTERFSTMHSRYSLLGSDDYSIPKNPKPEQELRALRF